jgi:Ion channel
VVMPRFLAFARRTALNAHHKRAVRVFGVVLALDILAGVLFGATDRCGLWNGLYFAIVTVTTVGYGDVSPHGWAAHAVAVAVMLLIIPTWTAVFSFFTTGLLATHVDEKTDKQTEELKEHGNGHWRYP